MKKFLAILIIIVLVISMNSCNYKDTYEAGNYTKYDCLNIYKKNKDLFTKTADIILSSSKFYDSRQKGSNHADIFSPNRGQKKYFKDEDWKIILKLFKTSPYELSRAYPDVVEVNYISKDYKQINEPDGFGFVYFKDENAISENMSFYTQTYPVTKLDEHWYFICHL